MRIQVIHIITRLELGGAQRNTLYTVANLDRRRFQPHLIAGEGGFLDEEAMALADVGTSLLPHLVREIDPLRDVLGFMQIRKAIREIQRAAPNCPIIVHTHSSKAGILGRWAARIQGVPVILHTYHGFGFHSGQSPPVSYFYRVLERLTSRATHGFIMVSRANMEKALRCGIGSRDRMWLIRSGIPIGQFQEGQDSRREIRRSLGVKDGEFLVVMVACLKPQKAPLDFARLAAKVCDDRPNSRFFLVGDGVLRTDVERESRNLALSGRFRLLGWRKDVHRILPAADAMVLTSRWEGLPQVLPQAMAAGLPVVATAVDGSPEAIRDGENGFLLQPGDISGMAERLLRLMDDPALRKRMGDAGRDRVGEYDVDRMVRQQEALYEAMISKWSGGGSTFKKFKREAGFRNATRGPIRPSVTDEDEVGGCRQSTG